MHFLRHFAIAAVTATSLIGAAGGPARAQSTTGLPPGFVCGMSYLWWDTPFGVATTCSEPLDGTCNAFASGSAHTARITSNCGIVIGADPGFLTYSDGDRGMKSGFGFYHQSWNTPNSTPPAKYLLPAGTACGFKEACNSTGQTCMGYDANTSCPPGWYRKWADDMNAPSGCGFVWCEYQDPNRLCTSMSCVHDAQPSGTVCGLTDSRKKFPNDLNGGQCMNATPSPTSCASIGYQFHGFWDSGSPSGTGVGFCMKP